MRYKCLFLILILLAPAAPAAADGVQTAGDVLQFALPALAAGLTAVNHDKAGAVDLLKSYALSLGTTSLLKLTVPETRPDGGNHSFPSGHTCSAFTAAEYVRARYGFKWGLPFYLTGVFVAYSRVESKQHYVHDVIAGAAIGIVSSHLFTRPFHGWNMALGVDHAGVAFGLQRQF